MLAFFLFLGEIVVRVNDRGKSETYTHWLALCTFVCMEGGETHGASTWSRVLHWYRLHNGVAEKGSLFLFQAGEPKVVGEGIFGISQGDNTGYFTGRYSVGDSKNYADN